MDKLAAAESRVDEALATMDFKDAIEALEPLCDPVDRLFDEVLIMSDDEDVKNNRLSLLVRLDTLFGLAADFSRLTWD